MVKVYLLESKIIYVESVFGFSLFANKKLPFPMPGSKLNLNSKNDTVNFLVYIIRSGKVLQLELS